MAELKDVNQSNALDRIVYADDLDWQHVHSDIYAGLSSVHQFPDVLKYVTLLLDRYLVDPRDAKPVTIFEQYRKRCLPFFDLRSGERHFLAEVCALLNLQTLMESLSNMCLSKQLTLLQQTNWAHVCAVIAALTISVRGSVPLLKELIQRLLAAVFEPTAASRRDLDNGDPLQSSWIDNYDGLGDSWPTGVPTGVLSGAIGVDADTSLALIRFTVSLLIARQLCAEASRLTGLTYAQWWQETFTRSWLPASMVSSFRLQLADHLIALLPHEGEPRLLLTQLSGLPPGAKAPRVSAPRGGGCRGGLAVVGHLQAPGAAAEAAIAGDPEEAMEELTSLDLAYSDACQSRWRDYLEIGRGRLAELRELQGEATGKSDDGQCPGAVKGLSGSTFVSPPATPGWSEVLQWLEEMSRLHPVRVVDDEPAAAYRLPHRLTEANLFQPRRFRCVLLPALLGAPELAELSCGHQLARNRLLAALRTAGLSHLFLESEVEADPVGTASAAVGKRSRPGCSGHQWLAKRRRTAPPSRRPGRMKR